MNDDSTKSSTIKSSTYSIGSSSRRRLTHAANNHFFEKTLLPLVSETNRTISEPAILRIVTYLIVVLQQVLGALFIFHPNTPSPKWLLKLTQIVFLYSFGEESGFLCYLHVVINFVIFILTVIICADYYYTNTFRRWELTIARVVHGCTYDIIILPSIISFFNSLVNYGYRPEYENGIIIFLNLIAVVHAIFQEEFIIQVLNSNPYITNNPVFFWHAPYIYRILLTDGIIFGLCRLSFLFKEKWYSFMPQIITLFFAAYHLRYHEIFTYDNMYCNVSIMAYLVMSTSAAVLSIIFNLCNYHEPITYFVVLIFMLIIADVVFYFFMKYKINKIVNELGGNKKDKKLSKKARKMKDILNMTPGTTKEQYLESLNINETNCFSYLIVGMQHASPLFLDWSLSRFLLSRYGSNKKLLIFITWMASFFPSESQFLGQCISLGIKMSNPPFYLKCFHYQLQRVFIFRQSTVSAECIQDFSTVKKKTKHACDVVSWFWRSIAKSQSNLSVSTTFEINQILSETDVILEQMIEKYPNNPAFVAQYTKFLLDGRSQFKNAIVWHQKGVQLQNGNFLQSDRMFRHFLQKYPFYLKNGIVDCKGYIIQNVPISKNHMTQSYSNFVEYSNSDSMKNEDIDVDEARKFLPSYKLRMALEHSMKNIKSSTIEYLAIFITVHLILGIAVRSLCHIVFYLKLESKSDIVAQVQAFNSMSRDCSLLSIELCYFICTSFSKYSNTSHTMEFYQQNMNNNTLHPLYYDSSWSLNKVMANLGLNSLNKLDNFTSLLYENFRSGDEFAYTYANLFSKETSSIPACYKNEFQEVHALYGVETNTLDYLVRNYLVEIMTMINATSMDVMHWNNSQSLCNIVVKNQFISTSFISLLSMLSTTLSSSNINTGTGSYNSIKNDEVVKNILFFLISVIPVFEVLILLPSIVIIKIEHAKEIEKYMSLIYTISQEDAMMSSRMLYKDIALSYDDESGDSTFYFVAHKFDWRLTIELVIPTINFLMLLVCGIIAYNEYNKLCNFFDNTIMAIIQRNTVFDIARDIVFLVFMYNVDTDQVPIYKYDSNGELIIEMDSFRYPFIDYPLNLMQLEYDFYVYSSLYKARNSFKSLIYGLDPTINDFLQEERCSPIPGSCSTIDYTFCLSFERFVTYLVDTAKLINTTISTLQPNSPIVVEFMYLVESRYAKDITKLVNLYFSQMALLVERFQMINFILFTLGIVLCVIQFVIEWVLLNNLRNELKVFRSLVLRIDPIIFASNSFLLNILLGNTSSFDTKITSCAQAAYQTSSDAIIFITTDLTIDSVNPATNKMFNLTTEQMIGQKISSLLNSEDNQVLYYKMKLMQSGLESMLFKCNGIGISGDVLTFPVKIVVIGISTDGMDNRANTFVAIVKDMTSEDALKREVEKAKRHTDEIIYQLIPREMLRAYPNSFTGFCFTVESATAIAIDIEKFSDYSASLQPADRLANLSKIYAAFDKHISLYPLVSPIKIMGDSYLAVCGLFNADSNKSMHSLQAVQFAIKCIESVDELNFHLNANLSIRVGICTGGPIVAGTLSKEHPVFMCFGDTIKFAMDLEKSGAPGYIQTLKETYEFIASANFVIEERSDVEVGKRGKMNTYLVSPNFTLESIRVENSSSYADDDIVRSNSKFPQMLSFSTYISNSGWKYGNQSNPEMTNIVE